MADEDISEWQQITSPSSTTSNNNNTQIAAVEITTLPLIEDITTDNNSNNDDEKGTYGNNRLKKSLRELSCWVVEIASKMRNYVVSKVGIGKFTCNRSRILAFLLGSLFYYMIQKKWRRQRQIDTTSNKLMLLLQQKDQK
ncbi:uncharacterized protein LOC129871585 isoform X2 [Solanum dulcamara]|nr:uncharacterized protein LOC129871585 isoform X2 [Solanum dulcamara]